MLKTFSSYSCCSVLQQNPGCWIHGNLRHHTAVLARHYPRKHSPNINQIEYLSDFLGRTARNKHAINNVNVLSEALVHKRNAVLHDVTRRYVRITWPALGAFISRHGG